jgi:hypothetical protein
MSKDNIVGAAFPTAKEQMYLGMSLRDYFAAKAMQGLLSGLLADGQDIEWAVIADNAYWQADAMLKAREQ